MFRTRYAIIHGRTRRTGPQGMSAIGELMRDLLDVAGTVLARRAAERVWVRERVVAEAEVADNSLPPQKDFSSVPMRVQLFQQLADLGDVSHEGRDLGSHRRDLLVRDRAVG